MVKVLERLGMQRTYLSITKAVYSKFIANNSLNGDTLTSFPVKSGPKQCCPLFPCPFNIGLES